MKYNKVPSPIWIMILMIIIFTYPKFKNINSAEFKFSILLPKNSEYKEQKYEFSKNITMHMYRGNNDEIAYDFGYFNVPTETNLSETKKQFDNMRDGALRRSKGNLISQTYLSIQNYTGIEYSIQDENYTIISRDYLINHTAYVIIIVAPNNLASSKDISKVFNSFTLA